DKTPADVFRAFLQFAEKAKNFEFKKVELAFRKDKKFFIEGNYFKKLGEEFSEQNPIYTMRTFPENLKKPNGENAYSKWEGGLLGVTSKQMEDFSDFHKQWYLEQLSKESSKELSDKVEIPKESIGEGELKGETNFRNTRWGMAIEEVKKIEGEPKEQIKSQGLDIIGYQRIVSGMDCLVLYIFAENKLTRAKYSFAEKHSNLNIYIDDFKKIKKTLTEKYGEPKNDNKYWLDDLYKDDYSDWGMAISVGDLRYFTTWDMPETTITLALTGDNYEISLVVEYLGKEFEELEEKVKKEAEEDIW
ncbi:MAG: hypothetical protein ACOC5T_03205, partial [Elusimicrobiota bacterium]